jgi:hypothetical protein
MIGAEEDKFLISYIYLAVSGLPTNGFSTQLSLVRQDVNGLPIKPYVSVGNGGDF